jgi:hypothetical protein
MRVVGARAEDLIDTERLDLIVSLLVVVKERVIASPIEKRVAKHDTTLASKKISCLASCGNLPGNTGVLSFHGKAGLKRER